MKNILFVALVIALLGMGMLGCEAPDMRIDVVKAIQAQGDTIKILQAANQQQTKDIGDLKTRLSAATKANTDLTAKLAAYPTRDELNKAVVSQAPQANMADLLNRLSAAEGNFINLKSQAATLQSQVSASIKQNNDYINTILVDKYASKADIANLQGQLNNLSAPAVTNLINQTNQLSASLLSAQQLITNLQAYGTQLQQIQTQINGLQSAANTIGALGNEVRALESEVNAMQAAQSPAALIALIQARVDNNTALVSAMQTQVNVAQGNIALLQGQIVTLMGQMQDLQNRLASHGW